MRALGAFVRVHDSRYIAGFAVVHGARVIATQSFPAPSSESEAGQLVELYARVVDLIDREAPDLFALKVSEIQQKPSYVTAHRAEGAVLGAAGRQRGLTVTMWSRQKLLKPAGLSKSAKTPEVIDKLCAGLSPAPDAAEVRQAAAAAVAALIAA